MEILNQKLAFLNPYGDSVPQIKQLAQQVGVASGVIIGGIGVFGLLLTFLFFGSTILTLTLTVLYPAVKSIQALESDGKDDDKEWLTYWIIFGLFSLIDDFGGFLLSFIPYYYWIKLAFFIYLLAPQTQGAKFLYNSFIKDLLNKHKDKIEKLISDVKGSATQVASEASRTAVNSINDPSNLLKAAQVVNQAQESLNKKSE